VTLETAVVQALNGISFGALLFILAAGLSLIFGMMDVVNLAHGAFYMLGAYITLTVVQRTGQFWIALLLAPLLIGALGLLIEPLLLRRLRGRHLDQVLLTIGMSLVIASGSPLVARSVRSRSRPASTTRSRLWAATIPCTGCS
jgi:branched-chain amino acid transport system permease protein